MNIETDQHDATQLSTIGFCGKCVDFLQIDTATMLTSRLIIHRAQCETSENRKRESKDPVRPVPELISMSSGRYTGQAIGMDIIVLVDGIECCHQVVHSLVEWPESAKK